MFWESGKEPQLYSTRQPPSNPCPVSYLYFAVFVRWRMPERVRQLSCSMKCFKATYFSKFALKSKIWNEVKSNLNIIYSANAWTGTVLRFCTQAWDGFSTRISTAINSHCSNQRCAKYITFMIPPLWLIVISSASLIDLCKSMSHKINLSRSTWCIYSRRLCISLCQEIKYSVKMRWCSIEHN